MEDILAELEFLIPRESMMPAARPLPTNLSGDEEKVYAAIELDETPIDLITQATGLPSGTVSSTLLLARNEENGEAVARQTFCADIVVQ